MWNFNHKIQINTGLQNRFQICSEFPATKDTRIVVVEMNGTTVGIVVDAVSEVLRISPEAIEPPSPIVTTVDSAFIRGIAKTKDRLIILLDLGKVLSSQEKIELHTLPTAA